MNKGKIMRKLLGQPVATNETVDPNSIDAAQLRPSASQNTIYSAGAPITCLDRSPDGLRAVIAGSKVFRTLRIDGSTISEDIDLRLIISSHATSHDISAAKADQLNIKAVKWSHSILDTTIIAACGNGRITIYDLNRIGEGLEVASISEHTRQVHKLAINPFKCNWLLSASQDGTVRSFDIRAPSSGRSGSAFRTQTFRCNADAVRDVKWSPSDGMEFACSTDAGMVQKWDIRKPSAPVLKFTAHQSACFSISWHPDGEHLISGGMDQHCHVWDVSKKAERGQKPRYSFATPAPVSHVSWRPSCWSATAQGQRAAQVTVSYDDSNANRTQNATVHIWDLARSSMPFKEIEQWDSSPRCLLWNTQDLLWSVDKDGHFTQTDVAFVPKVIDRRSLSTFSFSPNGDVLMLLEERQAPQRHRPSINSPEVSPSYQHNSNGPLLSVSRSDSEEDVVGSFLGPRRRKSHRRRHSGRSAQPLSTTPPNITGMADSKVMSLDDAVKVTGTYKPQQVMAIGHAPSTATRATYQYFTNRYLRRIAKDTSNGSKTRPVNVRIALVMEYAARTAENVGHYRLAQTWRILAYTINLLLLRRAEHHRGVRLTLHQSLLKDYNSQEEVNELRDRKDFGEETPRRVSQANVSLDTPIHHPSTYIVAEEIESTSNIATPLVRPMADHIEKQTKEALYTSIDEDDTLELPEAAYSTGPSPIPVRKATQSPDYTSSSVEGYDFYGIESFSPVIDFTAPQRKTLLRLDYIEQSGSPQRIQPTRHDSGESFQMFSTSGDSQPARFMSSSESDGHSFSNLHGPSLRETVSSWESTLSSNATHLENVKSDDNVESGALNKSPLSHSNESKQGFEITLSQNPSPHLTFRQEPLIPSVDNTKTVKYTVPEEATRTPTSEKISNDPNIIESDFLPWLNDPEFTITPIDPAVLVRRSITFETQSSALNASAMILLLRPLLPPDAIDGIHAAAILRQYHHRLASMKLFTEAVLLRSLCVPLYPSVFGVAQENVSVGYFCTDCQKPLENDPVISGSMWRCPRCKHAMDGCAVCRHRELQGEFGEGITVESALWWLCPGCGHGGHTTCMQAWHAGPECEEGSKHSGGSCPLEGCLHPCLPGSWRNKRSDEKKILKAKELDLLVKENSRQGSGRGARGVRRDPNEITQSKAVEGVRVALGMGAYAGIERKKLVKFIGSGEDG